MRKLIAVPFLALAAAGCGGDEEPKANVVDVQGSEYAFVMPQTIAGGLTTLQLRNIGKEPHEFALMKLGGGKTIADVNDALADPAIQQQGPPEWIDIRAGIPTLQRGETASLTQKMEPGRYVLICFLDGPSGKPHFVDGMIKEIVVEGDGGGEEPKADATLTLGKSLEAPELGAGKRTLALRNEADRPNAVFLISYKPGKTDADLVAWEEGGMKGEAPGEFHGGAIDVPPHSTVYYTYDFEDGKEYALVDDVNKVEKRFRVS